MKKILRLGTRGSPLALFQAEATRAKLLAVCERLHVENTVEIVSIRTSGDWNPTQKERTFLEMGGDKGLFVRELEEALLSGHIDMAVHSLKDVPSLLPPGLKIAAVITRADPRDAFVSDKAKTLKDLPKGAVVGTSSLRRQAQILHFRPDLRVIPLRGNIDTRIRKLEKGAADATVLAAAGLTRLGLQDRIASMIETDIILPAAAQGAIGIEIHEDAEDMHELLAAVDDAEASLCVKTERALVRVLDGSCETPLAALARLKGGDVEIEALAAKPDGTSVIRVCKSGPAANAEALGCALGEELRGKLPPGFFGTGA